MNLYSNNPIIEAHVDREARGTMRRRQCCHAYNQLTAGFDTA